MSIQFTGFADEISPQFETQLAVASATGVHAIEIRGVNGRGIQTYTPAEAEGLQKALAEKGMHVSSIGSPIGKIQITDPFEPHFEEFKNVVALCKVFGTRFIRMFSFYVPEGEAEKYEDEVMRRMERLIAYAQEQDVILLHENEKAIYGDIAPRCLKLMQRFYGDHFRAVFDFANFIQCGQDTLEAWEMMKPYIAYVHIKDAKAGSGQVTPAGWGDGHVKEILRKLKEKGYEGYLSLEPHLTDFAGFRALEAGLTEKKWQLDGETVWRIALDALRALLWELEWR
jgi:sugar phosphate isomerase/epimerase